MDKRINFSLTQIEYVMAVFKLGHFAKAAEHCLVTQPTLSMQIQKLEDDLGVILFDRSKKPILLTDAGKQVIEYFQSILSEAKKIPNLIDAIQMNGINGTLKFAAIPTIAPYVIPILLPVLEKKFPGLQLEIKEMETAQIIKAILDDDLDVGLLATPLKNSQITEKVLYNEPFSVMCHNDHELSRYKKIKYDHLSAKDIWLLTEGHCLRNQILDVCSLKLKQTKERNYRFESGSLETIKNLITSYGGYTLIPELAIQQANKKTVVIPFERPIPAREIGLVYSRKHLKLKLIDALAESIKACIPEHVLKIKPKDLDIVPIT